MVRRWSRINTFNNQKQLFTNTKKVQKFKNITLTRRFDFKMPNLSVFFRKRFFRRKHINKQIFYTNPIFNWSLEYRTGRGDNNTLFLSFFFKNNYLTYTVAKLKHWQPTAFQITENFLFSFSKKSYNFTPFLKTLQFSYLSTPTTQSTVSKVFKNNFSPLFGTNPFGYTPFSEKDLTLFVEVNRGLRQIILQTNLQFLRLYKKLFSLSFINISLKK